MLTLSTICLSSLANAKAICPRTSAGTVQRTIELAHNPNYFLRAARDTRELSFASADGQPNQILNLDTGKFTDVPGSIDPVLTGDGKLLVVPQAAVQDKSGLSVANTTSLDTSTIPYRVSDGEVRDKDDKVVQVTVDELKRKGKSVLYGDALIFYKRDATGRLEKSYIEPNAGNYQTMGVRGQNKNETFYRVLLEQNNDLITRDYRRDATTGDVSPAGEMHSACHNSALAGLPILSPNGREFTYYDAEARETKIMAFNDHGGCDQLDAIPALIGKPDFSPDGRYLAFHLDEKVRMGHMIFSVPEKDQKLGIYLYDRRDKTLSLLHDENGTNSYYPVFLNDHEIAFIEGAGDPEKPKMTIKLMKIEGVRGFACRGCGETAELREASGLLGAMYGAQCGLPDLSGGNASIALARLSPDNCREFAKDLSDAAVRAAQAQFDARLDWDPTSSKKMMKEIKRAKIDRPTLPMTAQKLAAICDRIELGSPAAPATTAK